MRSSGPVPEVSYAVILTRDVARAAGAMRAIARQAPPAELLLVLNDPDDAMRAYGRELAGAGARILHDGVDLGIVDGWNLALCEARSPHVCILHEDAEPEPGCAARLLQTLRERPDAGAVGPTVLSPTGAVSQRGAAIWSDGATSLLTALPTAVHPVDYAGSSCLVVDRRAALGVGGFDERFHPACYVDAALGVALWRAGRSVLCDSRATSVHRTGAMVDPARGPRRGVRFRAFLYTRNRERFRAAFGDWLAAQPDRRDEADARRPRPAELADVLTRARERERRLLAAPLAPLHGGIAIADDLERRALRMRRELEDEFLAELVAREEQLAEEAAGVHRAYAELVAREQALAEEVAGMHRRYAELVAREAAVKREAARLHRTCAEQAAELDRVHRAYAELWEDRERLRELSGSPLVTTDEHA